MHAAHSLASQQLRTGNLPQPCLGHEPLARSVQLTFLQDVVRAGWAVGTSSTPSADRYAPVRLGRMVLVELSGNV